MAQRVLDEAPADLQPILVKTLWRCIGTVRARLLGWSAVGKSGYLVAGLGVGTGAGIRAGTDTAAK